MVLVTGVLSVMQELVSLEVDALLVATVVIGELIEGFGERGAGVEGVMVWDGQDMLTLY